MNMYRVLRLEENSVAICTANSYSCLQVESGRIGETRSYWLRRI